MINGATAVRRKLGDCLAFIVDNRGKTPPLSDEGIELIEVNAIQGNRKSVNFDVVRKHVSQDTYDTWFRKGHPKPGDTLISTVGAIGRVAYCNRQRGCVAQNVIAMRPNRDLIDPLYLFYLLSSEGIQNRLHNLNIGVAQPSLKVPHLLSVELDFPDLPTQRKIAGILSAYDDLIENNLRRIRVLEEMAQSLYREWFVHFRFPGHQNTKLIDSPLGQIPEGWEVDLLENIKAEQPYAINGEPFGSKLGRKDYIVEGVPVIRGINLSLSGRFNPSGFVFVSDKKADSLRSNLAVPGDIVVTQRGTLGQIGMIPFGIGFERFVISQSQMKITPNSEKVDREYLFFFLRSNESTQRLKNHATSSGVPHINLTVLREFPVLYPKLEQQKEFGQFARGTEKMIEALTRKIETLRQTRDLLLPKLLNGRSPNHG